MALANFHTGMFSRNQRAGNAVFFFARVTEQTLGVVHLECQANHSGDWRQGDPAFAEGQLQTNHFLTFMHAFADDAGIRNRACI